MFVISYDILPTFCDMDKKKINFVLIYLLINNYTFILIGDEGEPHKSVYDGRVILS